MGERFENSPLRLRRDADGSVTIESGAEIVKADDGDDEHESQPGVPKPPPIESGWEVFVMAQDEVLTSLRTGGGDTEEALEAALAEHQNADAVRVASPSSGLTKDELKPLVEVSRRHGVPIDVHLDADG